MKDYECPNPQMAAYLAEVRKMEKHFDCLQLEHVSRSNNQIADELSKLATR